MEYGLIGIAALMSLVFVAALASIYIFKIDLIASVLGELDSFWTERAVWGWTPRRRPRPPDASKKRRRNRHAKKKATPKEEADEAREAAIKAARWPYE